MKSRENETTIVLVSDGEETCNAAPCEAIAALKASGVKFILHVVGFGVDERAKEQLSCFARAGGGRYFGARDASALLGAMKSVRKEVAQKVEKAKTTTKKAKSRLGKLRIRMPESGARSLSAFKIIRKKDGKTLKTIKNPRPDSTHPLLSGDYELIAAFANSNYRDPSDVSFGAWTVRGGETTLVDLGAMAVNIADSLAKTPAGAVIITRAGDEKFLLTLPYTGNSYYFYKTKPLPPGTYNFAVHYKKTYTYKTSEQPVVLARDASIMAGRESVVTLDSGFTLKKPGESSVTSWELIPAESEIPILKIERATNGDHPLWAVYATPPGQYNLNVYIEGMDEPLPAGEGIVISPGELLEFDAGL
ncbi:MAG: hypothetical protein GY859_11720 [Desulfobacterales bacterium]|nr:hypothetical protein [Desulfobacterales bacterium]